MVGISRWQFNTVIPKYTMALECHGRLARAPWNIAIWLQKWFLIRPTITMTSSRQCTNLWCQCIYENLHPTVLIRLNYSKKYFSCKEMLVYTQTLCWIGFFGETNILVRYLWKMKCIQSLSAAKQQSYK